MKRRIGSKNYDTDTAELIDTLPDGIQVYRKKGRSREFYLYNPNGKIAREMFFDLPPEEAEKYMDNGTSKRVRDSTYNIKISEYDRNRIMRLANRLGLSMPKFLLMLVDEYEKKNNISPL